MSKLRELFSIDLRSLALFRILLGALIACDLALRAGDIEAWYTDFGVLPVAASRALGTSWSLHALGGTFGFEVALFVIAGLFAIALSVGFHSRVAIFVCWVMTLSLLNRNRFIQGGSAVSLRVILFWSLTLPLGARWSIDSLRKTPLERRANESTIRTVLSVGTVCILLQIFLIYPMLVFEKLKAPCCWRNLTAVSRVLEDDRIATWISRLLRNVPWAHKWMAAATLAIESIPPFLAFSPVATPRVRTAAVFCLMFFHAVCMPSIVSLGVTFPGIMTTIWTLFLPPWFWDEAIPEARRWLSGRIPGFDERLTDARNRARQLLARIPRKRESQKRDASWQAPVRAAISAFLVACLCFVVLENGLTAARTKKKRRSPPRMANAIAGALGLRQKWALYVAPGSNRYYIFAATLSDGTRVDLNRNGRPLDWTKRRPRAESAHWTKLETNVASHSGSLGPLFADYYARNWDRSHPTNVVESLDLTVLQSRRRQEPSRTLILHREFDGRARPALNRDWSKAALVAGKPVVVRMIVDAEGIEGRRCKMASELMGMRCEPSDDDWDGESRHLRPFTRLEGSPFLAPADSLSTLAGDSERLIVDCTLNVQALSHRAEVKFVAADPWFETKTNWPIGTLSECKPISNRVGKQPKRKRAAHVAAPDD